MFSENLNTISTCSNNLRNLNVQSIADDLDWFVNLFKNKETDKQSELVVADNFTEKCNDRFSVLEQLNTVLNSLVRMSCECKDIYEMIDISACKVYVTTAITRLIA